MSRSRTHQLPAPQRPAVRTSPGNGTKNELKALLALGHLRHLILAISVLSHGLLVSLFGPGRREGSGAPIFFSRETLHPNLLSWGCDCPSGIPSWKEAPMPAGGGGLMAGGQEGDTQSPPSGIPISVCSASGTKHTDWVAYTPQNLISRGSGGCELETGAVGTV